VAWQGHAALLYGLSGMWSWWSIMTTTLASAPAPVGAPEAHYGLEGRATSLVTTTDNSGIVW